MNTVLICKKDPIIKNDLNEKDFYFVHSYIYENIKKENILGLILMEKIFHRLNKGTFMVSSFILKKAIKTVLN